MCFRQLWQWHPVPIAPSQMMSRNNSQQALERWVLLLCSMSTWDKMKYRWVRNCFLKWCLYSVALECAALNPWELTGCKMNMQQAVFLLELMLDRFLWERGRKTCWVSPSSGWKMILCSGGHGYWSRCLLVQVASAVLLFHSDLTLYQDRNGL